MAATDDTPQTKAECEKKHGKIWRFYTIFISLLVLFAGGLGAAVNYSISRSDAAGTKSDAANEQSHKAVEAAGEIKAVLPFVVKGIEDIRASQIRHEENHEGGGM